MALEGDAGLLHLLGRGGGGQAGILVGFNLIGLKVPVAFACRLGPFLGNGGNGSYRRGSRFRFLQGRGCGRRVAMLFGRRVGIGARLPGRGKLAAVGDDKGKRLVGHEFGTCFPE